MENNNLSVVLKNTKELCLESRSIPIPKSNEVLIAIHSVGICGSDIHQWKNGRIGNFIIKNDLVLGHESSGVVVKIGDEVKHLKPGDNVCIEPGVPCRKCEFCKKGRYNLCAMTKLDNPNRGDGSLSRYFCHDADYCFKLPANVSLEEGALMEPLAVAIHACKRAEVCAGKTILICGAGPIGLLALLTCKAMGVSKLCITDIIDERLDLAKKLGATNQINVKNMDSEMAMENIISCLDEEPDITLKCCGAESSVAFGLKITKSGGVLMLIGVGLPEKKLPVIECSFREIDIRGIFRYVNCFPIALELCSSGAIDVKPLISHRFKLEDALKAFDIVKTGADGAIKVLIQCSK